MTRVPETAPLTDEQLLVAVDDMEQRLQQGTVDPEELVRDVARKFNTYLCDARYALLSIDTVDQANGTISLRG